MTGTTAPPRPRVSDRMLGLAAALDAAAVMVFIAAGRRTHDQDPGISGLLQTAAPFLLALVLGWLVSRAWQRPTSVVTGAVVWSVTLVVGMVLRNLVFDRGTATSFVVVAAAFTFACLIGWRLVALAITRARAR